VSLFGGLAPLPDSVLAQPPPVAYYRQTKCLSPDSIAFFPSDCESRSWRGRRSDWQLVPVFCLSCVRLQLLSACV